MPLAKAARPIRGYHWLISVRSNLIFLFWSVTDRRNYITTYLMTNGNRFIIKNALISYILTTALFTDWRTDPLIAMPVALKIQIIHATRKRKTNLVIRRVLTKLIFPRFLSSRAFLQHAVLTTYSAGPGWIWVAAPNITLSRWGPITRKPWPEEGTTTMIWMQWNTSPTSSPVSARLSYAVCCKILLIGSRAIRKYPHDIFCLFLIPDCDRRTEQVM